MPAGQFRPCVYPRGSDERIRLFPSFLRPNMNDGIAGRMELFTFSATKGQYSLKLAAGSSISTVEEAITGWLAGRPGDNNLYCIQVRASQPFYALPIGIILMLIAVGCMVGGAVAGILILR
ncbi:hypothetical protein [Parapedobacter tibetensis]|uniref:hypothetical protein n=1 Tax=Parapedobacter tibetensis TaxID=2972951 RepID=UPI00214DBD04|nr:hypothetical protein [Parapedobacter tibetensis]